MPKDKLETALGTILQPLALTALNAAEGDGEGAGGPPYAVPEWIPLIPAPNGSVNGSLIVGVDGRTFKYEDPQAVIDATRMPIALDYDHGSVTAMWSGKSGEAAARLVELEMRDDEMWGRCEWTQEGHDAVEKGKYIYISPTFRIKYDYESDDPPEIKFLTSAALTNNPNLNTLPALNQQHNPFMEPESMAEEQNQNANANAGTGTAAPTEPEANAGDNDLAAMRQELAELRKEREQYQAARDAEANALRQELAAEREARETDRKAQRETAINAAVDQAITDRKITPAQRDYFLAQCQKENGLEEFNSFVAAQPQMLGDSGLEGRTPPGGDGQATLSAEDQAFCAKAGLDPAEFLKTKQAEQAQNGALPPAL